MKKKRKFALQAVLDYRRHVEESALRIVAERRRRFEAYAIQRERCEIAIEAYGCAIRPKGEIRLQNAGLCDMLSAALRQAIENNIPATVRAQIELDDACRAATAAARDRRVIEILRDRHLAAIAVADLRADEAEIAELDALRPRLRRSGSW